MVGRASGVWQVAVLALCLTGCAARQKNQMPPPVLDRAVLAHSVNAGQDFEPVEPAETFPAGTPEIFAWVRVRNISQACSLRWMWYAPDGSLYYDSGDSVVEPRGLYHPYVTSWHRIPVSGWQAAELTGAWKVVIQLNGTELSVLPFKLEPRPQQMIGGTRTGA